jgi:hypothetical protein
VAADAYWGNVVLLVHFDGANGATSASDVSYKAHTLTARNGAALTTAAGDFQFGTAALSVGGSGACFDTPSSTDFQFGTGDFTVECWLKTSDGTGGGLIDYWTSGQNGWQIFVESNGKLSWYRNATLVAQSSGAINDGVFHHVAAARAGTAFKFFVDGVQVASATDSGNYNFATTQLSIGRQNFGSPATADDLIAKIDDVRITKGIARYTAGFTAPSAAFPDDPVGAVTSLGLVASVGSPTSQQRVHPSGISAVALGTPTAKYTQFGTPTGIVAASLGAPRVITGTGQVSGISSVTLGTPLCPHSLTGVFAATLGTPKVAIRVHPSGIAPTTLGTPHTVSYHQAASVGLVVTLGTPWTPTNRYFQAAGVDARASFGNTVAISYNPVSLERTEYVVGVRTTSVGKPTARATITCIATGISAASVGSPSASARPRCTVTGLGGFVGLGTPKATMRCHAVGIHSVSVGAPKSAQVCHAVGVDVARVGAPTYVRGAAHFAQGFAPTRLGQPRARSGKAGRASGVFSVSVGTPSCTQRHHVGPMTTITHLGKPQMVRNPKC